MRGGHRDRLTEAQGIDSTNLGLLARIANPVQERFHHKTTLVSTNADVNRTLETMGFFEVFNVDQHPLDQPIRAEDLPPAEAADRETADAIVLAHRTLADLNERNREMFRSVVEALESDPENPTLH